MTPEQFDLIQQKSKWTDWRFPLNRNVKIRQVLFDLYELLPDENVKRFLRDCPEPGKWAYSFDEDTGEKSWFWVEPFERRQWYASCEIELQKVKGMTDQELVDYEKSQQEMAFLNLVTYLEEATDYSGQKSDEEVAQMYQQFETKRLSGPPLSSLMPGSPAKTAHVTLPLADSA